VSEEARAKLDLHLAELRREIDEVDEWCMIGSTVRTPDDVAGFFKKI
jgi:hypothetical protein